MKLSRRSFLRTLGAAGAGVALMPWLSARADDEPMPRVILFYTPHGTVWDRWRPTGSGTSFALSPILAPLERHKKQLVVIDGMNIASPYSHRVPHTYDLPALWSGSPIDTTATDFERTDHGVTFGWNTGTTIDQYLAGRLSPDTPFPTLELGVLCGGSHPATRMIYSGPRAPRHPLTNPGLAFDQVFGGDDGAGAERRRAVLDAALGDLNAVRPKLSASDRRRLDAHETAIYELQDSLGADDGCDAPDRPLGGGLDVIIDQQSDLLAAALACGKTRIASLQITKGDNDGALYPWVGIETGGHHLTSHDRTAAAQDDLAALYTWYSHRFAHLLDLLDALPDGNGQSVLDNSIVIWGSEIGIGWNHDISNVPFVVAGGGAGRVRRGRYLQVSGQHNRVLVDAAQVMGLTDVTSYGSTDNGSGGVPGLLT